MAINPNIALSFQGPKFEDPVNRLAQFEQLRQYRQNALLKEREMKMAENELASQNALKNLFASGQAPTTAKMVEVGGAKGLEMASQMARIRESEARAASAQSKQLKDQIDLGRTSLAAIPDDPKAYGAWRKDYVSRNPALAAFFPEESQYMVGGPDAMGTKMQLLLSADQLAQDENALKRLNMQLESQQKIAEANRQAAMDRTQANIEAKGRITPYQQAMIDAQEAKNDLAGQNIALRQMEIELKQRAASPEYKAQVAMAQAKVDELIANAKATKTANQAKENMASVLDGFQSSLDTLKQEGEIISTGADPGANVYAMAANSEPGQLLGKAFGTKGQQARQQIEKLKPVYMTLLSQATGLSAQQLNSNVEFTAFMNSIAGPDTGYEAATEQIKVLKKLFATKIPTTGQQITELFSKANEQIGIKPSNKGSWEEAPSGRSSPSQPKQLTEEDYSELDRELETQ